MCIYYFGYVTTNLINNKKYIGVHETVNPNDKYLGSGTAIQCAIKKYGTNAFIKEIIEHFPNSHDMYLWEAIMVTQDIVDDRMYYNMQLGGLGGGKYIRAQQTINKMKISQNARLAKSAELRARKIFDKKQAAQERKIQANEKREFKKHVIINKKEEKIKQRELRLGKKVKNQKIIELNTDMNTRPICNICHIRPCAINYHRKGKVYFRSKCGLCKNPTTGPRRGEPLWKKLGYQKRNFCERCHHRSSVNQIFVVYFIDGDLRNVKQNNVKTICANCQIELSVLGLSWQSASTGLISDF